MDYLQIFDIQGDTQFEKFALETFRWQFRRVTTYRNYVSLLGVDPERVCSLEQIPFLPVQFFKTHEVIADGQAAGLTFTSSGTTGTQTSRHRVVQPELYRQSFSRAFRHFYGEPQQYCILALLPSYLERSGSSLIYMVQSLIQQSGHPGSGFYLNQNDRLVKTLQELDDSGQQCLLLGVTFALLDLAERFSLNLNHTVVMETGGMKGRRQEILRDDLHAQLCGAFGVNAIHSEYGMTELLSQAYSTGGGIFTAPPWMRVLVNEPADPLTISRTGKGALNIIDLANRYSCSFIKTEDLGEVFDNETFTVMGRLSNAPIRGCNMLVE